MCLYKKINKNIVNKKVKDKRILKHYFYFTFNDLT